MTRKKTPTTLGPIPPLGNLHGAALAKLAGELRKKQKDWGSYVDILRAHGAGHGQLDAVLAHLLVHGAISLSTMPNLLSYFTNGGGISLAPESIIALLRSHPEDAPKGATEEVPGVLWSTYDFVLEAYHRHPAALAAAATDLSLRIADIVALAKGMAGTRLAGAEERGFHRALLRAIEGNLAFVTGEPCPLRIRNHITGTVADWIAAASSQDVHDSVRRDVTWT